MLNQDLINESIADDVQHEGPGRRKGRGGLETPRAVHLQNRLVADLEFVKFIT